MRFWSRQRHCVTRRWVSFVLKFPQVCMHNPESQISLCWAAWSSTEPSVSLEPDRSCPVLRSVKSIYSVNGMRMREAAVLPAATEAELQEYEDLLTCGRLCRARTRQTSQGMKCWITWLNLNREGVDSAQWPLHNFYSSSAAATPGTNCVLSDCCFPTAPQAPSWTSSSVLSHLSSFLRGVLTRSPRRAWKLISPRKTGHGCSWHGRYAGKSTSPRHRNRGFQGALPTTAPSRRRHCSAQLPAAENARSLQTKQEERSRGQLLATEDLSKPTETYLITPLHFPGFSLLFRSRYSSIYSVCAALLLWIRSSFSSICFFQVPHGFPPLRYAFYAWNLRVANIILRKVAQNNAFPSFLRLIQLLGLLN